jgi:hypothetical protein
VRVTSGLRGADVTPACPLADRVPGHAGQLARFAGEEMPVHFRHGRKVSPARAAVASPGRDRAVRVGSAGGRVCSAAGDLDVPQAHMSDHDRVAVGERGLADPLAVDEDAVEAAIVEQHGLAAAVNDHRVAA